MPLQVYLDSSDYSELSAAADSSTEALFDYLTTRVSQGDIEVRFSGISLAEALHTKSEYRPAALNRAACIREICQGRCVIDHVSLWKQEMLLAQAPVTVKNSVSETRQFAFAERNLWYPSFVTTIELPSIDAHAKRQFDESIAEASASRHERRRAKSMAFRRGKLSSSLRRSVVEENFGKKSDLQDQYGITDHTFELLMGWVGGTASNDKVCDGLASAILDPYVFVKNATDAETVTNVRGYAYQLASVLSTMYAKLYQSLSDLLALRAVYHLPESQFNMPRFVDKSIRDRGSAAVLELAFKDQPNCWPISPTANDLVGKSLCVGLFIEAFIAHVKALVAVKNEKQLSKRLKQPSDFPSDSGDLLQATYAPLFDVFRADAHTSDILRRTGIASHNIVPKLSGLHRAIETKLVALECNKGR